MQVAYNVAGSMHFATVPGRTGFICSQERCTVFYKPISLMESQGRLGLGVDVIP